MKYLVVVLVVVVAVWLMIRGRNRSAPPAATSRRETGQPAQALVACSHCGVHLPMADAVADRTGNYCTEAHRLAGPGSA
jgi:uncharacterized protein